MIAKSVTGSTSVICGECGSTIYVRDPDSIVDMDEHTISLRCRNSCCGHVGRYTEQDLAGAMQSRIIDHTTGIFLLS